MSCAAVVPLGFGHSSKTALIGKSVFPHFRQRPTNGRSPFGLVRSSECVFIYFVFGGCMTSAWDSRYRLYRVRLPFLHLSPVVRAPFKFSPDDEWVVIWHGNGECGVDPSDKCVVQVGETYLA